MNGGPSRYSPAHQNHRPSAMKLSFSLGSKPQYSLRKPSATSGIFADKIEKANDREYITEFDSSKLSVDPSKAKQVPVLPPIPNEWWPYKLMKNLDLPLQHDADHQQSGIQFEVDPLSSVEPSSNSLSNGLNLRSSNNSTNDKAIPAAEKNLSSALNNGDIRQQMMLREDLRSSKRESKYKDRRKESGRVKEEVKGNHKVSWLTSHIRVRIISRKKLKGGKLFWHTGEVVDVVGPTTCDVLIDENRELVQGVDQELLMIALPRRGEPVLVLFGRHKGVYGSLVEMDTDKETGVIRGVVRDAETHELLTVGLGQIAVYLGDPSYIGY